MTNIFKNLLKIITLFLFISSSAHALPDGYPKCMNNDVNKSDFCPLESKLGHTLIMVDFTSRWEKPQIDWVKNRIFGDALINSTAPYHRISYLKIDNTPPHSQEYTYSKCRFKTGSKNTRFEGDKVNTKCEGEDIVKNIYRQWRAQIDATEKGFFRNNKDQDQSLIYEYIIHVLREFSADFGPDYKERELIIVSDLMQFSKRVNFFKHCKSTAESLKPKSKQKADKCRSFETLMKKEKSFANYIDRTKPNAEMVKDLKVKILFINHGYQTRKDLYITLEQLWVDIFNHIGIKNFEIIPQIDF